MKTKTIQQTVTFKALPRQVYDMIMDSRKHSALSGERANIGTKVGGKFTAWGPHISGVNLVRKPGKKIVQAWRATGWWPDHYSIAIFDIMKVPGGYTLLRGRAAVFCAKLHHRPGVPCLFCEYHRPEELV